MGKIKVESCEIEGLKVITPTVFGDERGYFMETYNYNDFKEAGIDVQFVQDVGPDLVDELLHVSGLLLGSDVDTGGEVGLFGDQELVAVYRLNIVVCHSDSSLFSVLHDGDGHHVALELLHGDVDRVEHSLRNVHEDGSAVGDLQRPGTDDPSFLESGVFHILTMWDGAS